MKLKTVCLLLSLCHAGSAAALGLGELNLHSHLGQPLHASIRILDAGATTTAGCFSIASSEGAVSTLQGAQLSLERAGNESLLHIRSPQAIHDPFVQFALTSDCEARLRRDYVVLLDPPTLEQTPASRDMVTSAPRNATPAPRSERAIRTARHADRPRQPAAPRPAATTTGAPRLVLSGKRHTASAAFALRFDTNLPDLARPRPEALTATELSDENTALNRKLAHLESELAALRQRNRELTGQRATAPAAAAATPPAKAKSPVQWPFYLLAAGLLIGGAALLAAWLRRRSRRAPPRILAEPALQIRTQPEISLSEMMQAPDATPVPAPQRMPEMLQPAAIETTEVKDDILDQAEVCMAHGHGELAAHLLQEHLREAPTESPVPWLLLLDLLHRAGDTAGYAAASAECRRYFNVNISDHPVSQDNESGLGLEAYPHLLERLVQVWNSPTIETFFNDLIYDNRGGTRIGFEPGAYRDILLLHAIARDTLAP